MMTVNDYIHKTWPLLAKTIVDRTLECDRAGGMYTLTMNVSDNASPDGILGALFIWSHTPEGREYWAKLAHPQPEFEVKETER